MYDEDEDDMQEIEFDEDEDDGFSGNFNQLTTESGDLLDDSNPFGFDDFDELGDDSEAEDE